MFKIFKKVLIVFLVVTLTYYNFLLIGANSIKSLISYAIDDEAFPPEVIVKDEVIKNTYLNVEGETKKVIQVKVTSGIQEKDHPIKNTIIKLKTSILDGYELEDVKVTKLNQNSFTKGSWVIENGEIEIFLANENEELLEKEQGLDELLVTYVYKIDENINQEFEDTILNSVEKIVVETYSGEILEKYLDNTSFVVGCDEEPIVKLNIENKDIHKTKMEDETNYIEYLNINLSYRVGLNNIIVKDESDSFYNNEEQKLNNESTKYVKTSFNKEDLISLLGEDGLVSIENGEKTLAQISKDKIVALELNEKTSQVFEENEETRSYITITENTVEVEYAEDVEKIEFNFLNISKQSKEDIELSNLIIENTKTIFNVQNIDSLSFLKETKKCILNEEEETIESTINFKETMTKAFVEVNNNEWLLGETNNVNYRIILDTTSEKSELFVNPIFLLELPESVESINKENSEFYVENGDVFTEKNVTIATLLGRKFVVISLKGEQTEESIVNGNAVINLLLSLNTKKIEKDNETAKLYYRNNTVTVYENLATFGINTVDIVYLNKQVTEEEEIINQENNEYVFEENVDNQQEVVMGENGFLATLDVYEDTIKVGNEVTYYLYINNYNYTDQSNVIVEDRIPEGLELVDVELYNHNPLTYGYTDKVDISMLKDYNEQTKVLTVKLDTFKAATLVETEDESAIFETSKFLKITVRALALPENTYSNKINNQINIIKNGAIILSKYNEITVLDSSIQIETNKIKDDVENDEVIYEINVKNLGLIEEGNARVNFVLPDEYVPNYILSENYAYSTTDRNLSMSLVIPAQSTYKILFYGTHAKPEDTVAQEEVNNNMETNNVINNIFNSLVDDISNNNLNYNTIMSIYNSINKGGMLNGKV